MSYLGDPAYFRNIFENAVQLGAVTIANGTAVAPQPFWGDTVTVPGLTHERISPGLVYSAAPWHVDLNQLRTLPALDLDPEPPVQAAPEPFSAPPRRRAMVLDGDIPVGA